MSHFRYEGLSHVVGARSGELLSTTIPDLLNNAVLNHGSQLAVVFRSHQVRWTYREFQDQVRRLAKGLVKLGLSKGDRVGIWAPNRPEWLLTQFASAEVGLTLVNINPAYRPSELEYALIKVGCKAIICADSFKSSNYLNMLREIAPELSSCSPGQLAAQSVPELKSVIVMSETAPSGTFSFGEILASGETVSDSELNSIALTLDADDPINIQFTSGTTGSPKGATLTHRNIVNNAVYVGRNINLTSSDKLCIPVPLYHCFGMVMGVLACVAHGSTMLFPGEAFESDQVLATVREEKASALHGVPTMFLAILDHPDFDSELVSNLRTGIMAGAPCPVELMKRVVSELHMSEVSICYGMTETSPVSFQTLKEDTIEQRVSTVGRVMPHLEVKLIDQAGNTVPIGSSGEICTKGYSVMQGYWGDPERTGQTIGGDGFLRTGDLGTIDADGYCRIVGRVKDMIIRGGENIYPREIEEYLLGHPKIQDVQVFGVPDGLMGEQVSAWIVLHRGHEMTAEEVTEYCKGKITHYKVPKHIRFRKELPQTVTGKPQKYLMRAAMVKELGLED